MDLASALSRQVANTVRHRGDNYYRQGRVTLLKRGVDFVSAAVSGSKPYHVELARRDSTLVVSCTCPYFDQDLETCKHIWAAILASSVKGYLVSPAGNTPRWLEPANPYALGLAAGTHASSPLKAHPQHPQWADPPGDAGPLHATGSAAAPQAGPHAAPSRLPPPWSPRPLPAPPPPAPPPPPTWRTHLATVLATPPPSRSQPIDDLQYVIDLPATGRSGGIVLEIHERNRKANGDWGKLRPLKLDRHEIAQRVSADVDRQILSLLAGARHHWGGPLGWESWQAPEPIPARIETLESLSPLLVPLLAASGHASLRHRPQDPLGSPLFWDAAAEPWKLWLAVRRSDTVPAAATADTAAGDYLVSADLRRGAERLALDRLLLTLRSGFVFTADRVARIDHGGAFSWIPLLSRQRRLEVPAAEIDDLMARLFALPDAPLLDLPPELRCKEVTETPIQRLVLLAPSSNAEKWQRAAPSFRYSAGDVTPAAPGRLLHLPATRQLIRRDRDAEARALERLRDLGFQPSFSGPGPSPGPAAPGPAGPPTAATDLAAATLRIERHRTADLVPLLLAEGWLLEAAGRPLHAPGRAHLAVSSQMDWFELHGGVDFAGQTVPFPQLLAALRRGETTIRLGDGSSGLLPEEWLRRFAPLAAFGQPSGDHLTFRAAQVGFLDALLATDPAATCDAAFARARQRLASFAGIEPAAAPRGFRGELRAYQKAGLGWLHFLREFGFGGCLADDMGLGKTIQVLALLETRRTLRRRQALGPSLVVVPRSLIFNWIAEAAHFTPKLLVRNHTGIQRDRRTASLAACDLVLTTYGTLRRDAAFLCETEFDYIVLDEAQAIKNPDSESAKAARRLRGRHRLVLTGTPVENHLGDLWSLLEFLNPGITGTSTLLRAATAAAPRDPATATAPHAPRDPSAPRDPAAPRDPDPATRAQLARSLRPFILRRTKEQVAPELPPKVEQTIFCELPARQRKLYDELRLHYRAALGERVRERGLNRVKILVLEALLRLRQAACHPGLLDPARAQEPSAKLDFLLPQLAEVLDAGHKALVFSQFTSFLAILRQRLDEQHIPYAYLDGRTRDRAERVARFQTDPACNLFLISLKAGGLGLNLTAAGYVYLLDPWWNPAVEAQAIDRAHRIGQTRQVFAYRIVAKDTVEEKILLLQQSKRQLADAIVTADDSLLRRLTRDDLELLLS
jgi:superfamily II DNA or RNA helicase